MRDHLLKQIFLEIYPDAGEHEERHTHAGANVEEKDKGDVSFNEAQDNEKGLY